MTAREWWDPAATWITSSPDNVLIHRGWSLTHTFQPHYVRDVHYCIHFCLGERIKVICKLLQVWFLDHPDLASWSPWPSCPSEPRPQLQTSVSRDGSPSSSSSSGAPAWVWPPEDFLHAFARCRRGDPERNKTLWWPCGFTNRSMI